MGFSCCETLDASFNDHLQKFTSLKFDTDDSITVF